MAVADLRSALAQPDDRRVAAAREVLLTRLRALGTDDRAAVEPEADTLLARATERLRTVGLGDAAAITHEPAPSPTTGLEPSAPSDEVESEGSTATEIVAPRAEATPSGDDGSGATAPTAPITTEPHDDGAGVPDD